MADNFNISDQPSEITVPNDVADGTAGELLTWDAAGNAAVVATGNVGQVLTSGGAGTAPSFV